ncbi:CIC11C00000005327 [Sungouiella intermedia]|uniref:CIC11C00000005327 n=1 Tax=Sungouiella intermedia TaxID=45354 RepID=A0A1L0E1N7_9ASCO|nr:CIC11C00000005327 [[Candida] intermedia]
MDKKPQRKGIPAITGEIDESKAIRVFPEALLPYRSTVLAYGTSLVATTIGFPFDTVKTRIQTYKKFTSYLDCIVKTYKAEGIRGFYRGITAPLISTAFVRSLSVSIFTGVKPYCYDALYGWRDGSQPDLHPFVTNFPVCFLAGALAGCGVSVFACPFEFTKVYSQIASLAQLLTNKAMAGNSIGGNVARPAFNPHLSLAQVVRNIIKSEGPKGLYSGYKYHLLRDLLGSGVYFAVYESFKWASNSLINGDPAMSSPVSILLAGGMSGVTCWAIIFPFDTVKLRIQKDIVTNILRTNQGLEPLPPKEHKLVFARHVYRGVGMSMTRSFVVNMVFFSTYEFGMKHLI